MRCVAFFVLLAGILILPNLSWSQGPGGGGGPGGGNRGGRKKDPDAAFNKLSKGKDTIVVSELDAAGKGAIDRMGLKGDKITREQFKTAMQNRGGFGSGGPSAMSGSIGGGDRNTQKAESAFRRYDKDSDGQLSSDEMPEDLRRELDKYDTDKNGFISLDEFKVYMADKMGNRDQNNQGAQAAVPMMFQPTSPPPVEDSRPTVYRAGKLPKELPDWFVKLDRDGDNDGQVGLDEWRKGGKPLAEFKIYDLNGDGLITAEEFLKYTALIAKANPVGGSATIVSSAQAPNAVFAPPSGVSFPIQGNSGRMGRNGFNAMNAPASFSGANGISVSPPGIAPQPAFGVGRPGGGPVFITKPQGGPSDSTKGGRRMKFDKGP